MKIKLNSKRISKIKLCVFSVELPVLLIMGIYNLVKDNSIVIHSFVILIIGYSISLIKTIVSKPSLQTEAKTFTKKNMMIGILLYLFCVLLSVLRKQILIKYFIGQQITMLTIWFIIGVIMENSIVLLLLFIKAKEIKIPLMRTVLK